MDMFESYGEALLQAHEGHQQVGRAVITYVARALGGFFTAVGRSLNRLPLNHLQPL